MALVELSWDLGLGCHLQVPGKLLEGCSGLPGLPHLLRGSAAAVLLLLHLPPKHSWPALRLDCCPPGPLPGTEHPPGPPGMMEGSGGCGQVDTVASVTCSELSIRSGTSLEVGSWSGAYNVLEQWGQQWQRREQISIRLGNILGGGLWSFLEAPQPHPAVHRAWPRLWSLQSVNKGTSMWPMGWHGRIILGTCG